MVHALREAHRVLKPNARLVDLRPAAVHRRVGLSCDGRYQLLGVMREKLDDDRAANRAVARVVREGLFRAEARTQFDCQRVMDSLEDFRAWMAEFVQLAELPPHDWLIQRVEQAVKAKRGKKKIIVRGPLVLRLLRKMDVTC